MTRTKTNFKNLVNECIYFSESAKNYFLQNIELEKDIKLDFDVNYSFYKLLDCRLIVNNKVCYTFKTKKEFLNIVHEINFLNALEELKTYNNITIFTNFKKYDTTGNGIYNIRIYANYPKQERILNITSLIATLRACKGYNAYMVDGSLLGYDMDAIYIERDLKQCGFKCFR